MEVLAVAGGAPPARPSAGTAPGCFTAPSPETPAGKSDGHGDTEASRSVGGGAQTTVPWGREKSSSPQLGPQALTRPKLSTSAMTRSTRSATLLRRIEHHCQRAVQRGRYLSSHKLAHSRDIAPRTEPIPMLSGYSTLQKSTDLGVLCPESLQLSGEKPRRIKS